MGSCRLLAEEGIKENIMEHDLREAINKAHTACMIECNVTQSNIVAAIIELADAYEAKIDALAAALAAKKG